jgi:hypothetical protein
MASANRNNLRKSHIDESRNQRDEAVRTPGAEITKEPATPEEAEHQARRNDR